MHKKIYFVLSSILQSIKMKYLIFITEKVWFLQQIQTFNICEHKCLFYFKMSKYVMCTFCLIVK